MDIRHADTEGKRDGRSAALAVLNDMDGADYADLLAKYEEGDPAVYDIEPQWCTVPWSRDELDGAPEDLMIVETYETSATQAFWTTLTERCAEMIRPVDGWTVGEHFVATQHPGIVLTVTRFEGGDIVGRMVGDNQERHYAPFDCTKYDEPVCPCGQAGCAWAEDEDTN